MAKKNTEGTQPTLPTQTAGLSALISDIHEIIEDKARSMELTFSEMNQSTLVKNSISTGVLSIDLAIGGGYAPGRYCHIFGDTGTCKSTLCYHTIKEAILRDMIAIVMDYESSVDPSYLEHIGIRLDEACGFRNKKGDWEIAPKVKYATWENGDIGFNYMASLLRILPNKISKKDLKDDVERHFLVANDFRYIDSWASINDGLKKGKIIEVEDGTPQIIFFIDSLRAMLPKSIQDVPDTEMPALHAKMLSRGFQQIKSLLGSKKCNLIATNNITVNPMARFQNPETETGGSAVKVYPDFKMKMIANRSEGKMIEEQHYTGKGLDRYIMGRGKIVKNKFGPSFREVPFRLWLDELADPGRGFCPVFDTYNFLESCLLIDKIDKETFGIKLEGFNDRKYTWMEFKKFILVEDEKEALRDKCKEMLRQGEAQKLYYDFVKNQSIKKKKPAKGMGTSSSGVASEDEIPELEIEETTLEI